MPECFLLDTNAYFNFLRFSVQLSRRECSPETTEAMERIKAGACYISALSQVEIISVIGKYARGQAGGYEKCDCIISTTGERCQNFRYRQDVKRMKPKIVLKWLELISDTLSGVSPVLTLSVLPFSEETVVEAQSIIRHALVHNFGSLDAMIAATANAFPMNHAAKEIVLVTSDKGLKSCLTKCGIPYWDAFQKS